MELDLLVLQYSKLCDLAALFTGYTINFIRPIQSPSFSMLPPSSTVKLMMHLGRGYSLATIQEVLLYKKINDQRKDYNNNYII